jgi:CBS domain-containing protein
MQFDQRTAPAAGDPGFKLERVELQKGRELHPLNEFMLFLTKYPCKDNVPRNTTGVIPVWKEGKVVTVDKTERIASVLNKFIVEGFQGAPVLDEYRKYAGFTEMLDIVWYVVRLFSRRRMAARTSAGLADFFAKEKRFEQAKVEDVMNMALLEGERGGRGVQAVNGDLSLFSVMEIFARTGIRRIPVVDDWDNVSGIITQSMMISLISQNIEFLGDVANVPVREFQDDLQFAVQTIERNALTIDAFETMVNRNISGLGIIDTSGFLIDTISVRDLRGIGTTAEKFGRLWESVDQFKKQVRSEFREQTPPRPIMCSPRDTLAKVIQLMDDGNIHRVFVVESEERPVPLHVISQIDVIRQVLGHFQRIAATLRVRPRMF